MKFMIWLKQASLLLLAVFSLQALAVVEGHKYPFDDKADTERFKQLAEELRCPKCQNQNLADSNAPIASDMRDKVYELMQQGQDDDQIVDYLVDRYGDFVHYVPPMRTETFLLWFGPLIVFALGVLLLIALRRGQKKQPPKPLTAEEKARLAQLTGKDKG